jgi:amino acid adenylation domain-containing protein
MSNYNGLEIAIIGMSGRFPGADDIKAFWENLKGGVESIRQLSDEELLAEGEDKTTISHPDYVKAASFLDNKEYFDSAFFGFRPEEARLMDPQIRIFLETCWSALEDGGYNPENNQEKIGLFAGGHANLNWENYSILANQEQLVDGYSASQLRQISYLCSRVSYLLNLQGPSVYLNTACSTSLVAVQRASMSLLLNECKMALAGGIRINNYSRKGYKYQEGMINSRDGHCRAFDADSSGTVGGEGVGVVLLKKLKDAIQDGDTIHAVIKGSAVNNDGSDKMSFTAPSVEGQYKTIAKAMKMAKVAPETIGYVETHGTGTSLGDPIEVEALKMAFGNSDQPYCGLGAVKTNIGHLDAAAGITGLIKAVLTLKHRQLPPTLHFRKPNPEISFDKSPFYVNATLKPWEKNGHPLRAGVSSFGIGGTNAHVILEEAPAVKETGAGRPWQLLTISAKTRSALEANWQQLKHFLSDNTDLKLADIGFTLQKHRAGFKYRKAILLNDNNQLINEIESVNSIKETAEKTVAGKCIRVFMFSGQGTQYVDMCRDLYRQEPYFKEQLDGCLAQAAQFSGKDLRHVIFSAEGQAPSKAIHETENTQPALFMIEYALAKLLMHWGIHPDKMIGHSIGEYVAACLSGLFTLEDALKLVVKRGELMQQAPEGDMLSVSISRQELLPLLEGEELSLAVVNSSELCAVSGTEAATRAFQQKLEAKGIQSRTITTSHAFHSHMMEPILDQFKEEVSQVSMGEITIPFISNLTARPVTQQQVSDPQYWVDQLRQTVNFAEGVETLLQEEQATFIEIGPGRSLSTFVRSNKKRTKRHQVINLTRPRGEAQNDQACLLAGLGKIWETGLEPDWHTFYENEIRRKVNLPTYAFDKLKYPVIVDAFKMVSEMMADNAMSKNKDLDSWFYQPVWKIAPPVKAPVTTEKITTLICSDSLGVADQLQAKLESEGGVTVAVKAGERFSRQSPVFFTLNTESIADFEELWSALKAGGNLPQRVIYTWGMQEDHSSEVSEEELNKGFYQLFELVKSWQKYDSIRGKVLTVLSKDLYHLPGQQAHGTASQAMAPALLKVLSQEFPTLTTSHIDLSAKDLNVERLLNEIQQPEIGETVALRGAWRFVQHFDAVVHPKADTNTGSFHEGGTYLITGGLGSLGINLSRYLLSAYKARLILIGRTELTAENQETEIATSKTDQPLVDKLEAFKSLEKLDGAVAYFACDITDKSQLASVVEKAEARFGKIQGAIHAAGANRGATTAFSDLDKTVFENQFTAKVQGLQSLKAVLGHKELDFCILTSSLSVVLGGLGFGAYAPANAFMDAYVRYWQAQGQLNNWLSVNLDGLDFGTSPGNHISAQELPPLFEKLLQLRQLPQVVVSTTSLQKRLANWIRQEQTQSGAEAAGVQAAEELTGSTTEALIALWEAFFGKTDLEASDDFFEIGGDSLKALTMIGRIHKAFHVEVSVKDFFEKPVLSVLAEHIDSLRSDEASQTYLSIPKAKEQDYYPLSSAQKRLFFLYEFDKDSLAYNSTHLFKLEGKIEKDRLSRAFEQLIARHESLRTRFDIIDQKEVQQVLPDVPFELEHFQVTEKESKEIISHFIRPFDLRNAPLIRAGLVTLSDKEAILIVDLHHIITDGVSFGVLARDFMALYNQQELAALKLQYKDFAAWQQNDSHQKEIRKQRQFWLDQFAEETSLLQLPTDFPRPLTSSHKGSVVAGKLDHDLTSKLKAIADKQKSTLYMVMLAAYNILLSKLSGQEDIVVGSDLAGRPHADLEKIIGMFIHTVPLRNYPKSDLTFTEFLNQLRTNTLACFDNQSYQYEELVDELNLERNTNRNPLFDVMFAWQNFEGGELKLPGLSLQHFPHELGIAKFDMSLTAEEFEDEIIFKVEYATDLFRDETMERFVGYFQQVVQSVTETPEILLAEIELVDGKERTQLIHEFNNTDQPLPASHTFIPLFEEQVRKTPSDTAVIHNDTTLTYEQLNSKVMQLAGYLQSQGIRPQVKVALYMPRGIDMLTSILATFRVGAGYVPIDVNYPEERTREILWNSEAEIVLADRQSFGDVEALQSTIPTIRTIALVDHLPEDISSFKEGQAADAQDLAYIIYTSGTTGKPKGVMIHQQGMINHLYAKIGDLGIRATDVVAQTASPCFDISVWQFLSALLVGGKTLIVDGAKLLEPRTLIEELDGGGVTIFESVPSLITSFLDGLPSGHSAFFRQLRWMVPTGEALSAGLVKKWYSYFPDIPLVNAYGPTEASDDVTHYTVPNSKEEQLTIPIGKPIQNIHIYVLDKNLKLCPIGVRGEIHVAGLGVGLGYWKDREKTAKAFIPNPFAAESGHPDYLQLYKTGDVGYFQQDGNVVCLGRVDEQVKIRGNRIELGEIEYQLNKHKQVSEGVVLAKEKDGDKYLVAYYEAEAEIVQSELREYLADSLPEYMVPSYFVFMPAFPLTNNGKLNRKALPDPVFTASDSYVPAASETEQMLVSIWSEILKVEEEMISTDTSFFELGGHSLRAMLMVNKILKDIQVEVPLKEVFERRDIQRIAGFIDSAEKSTYASIEQAGTKTFYPTSSAQKRQYFLYALNPESTAYNSAQVVTLKGKLDKERLESTFSQLLARHESLRTSFRLEDDQPVQFIAKRVAFEVEQFTGTASEIAQLISAFVRPFELDAAPLIRVGLIALGQEEHILMVDMHHIITDGVSQAVLIKEFGMLYQGHELPPLRVQYKDYAHWQQSEPQQKKIANQKEFWSRQFAGELEVLNLPTDYPRTAMDSNEGDLLKFSLTAEQTRQLRKLTRDQDTTLFQLLLAIYHVLLSKLSNQDDIVVGTPTAGRPNAEFERVIGMFVNVLPLRNKSKHSMSFSSFLSNLKANVLECFDNQDYQYEELVEDLNMERDPSRNPLFDTMFMFQAFEESELEIEGLTFEPYRNEHTTANFDLTLVATDRGDELSLNFEYATGLFATGTMERFADAFRKIVDQVVSDPEVLLADIEVIADAEKLKVLNTFNQTSLEVNMNTIHGAFGQVAEVRKSEIALVFEKQQLTYKELNEKSNQLAHRINASRQADEGIIGIMVPRSHELFISILAVLKSGCAYVPIDPSYPVERISYIIENSGLKTILSTPALGETCDALPQTIKLVDVTDERLNNEAVSSPAANTSPEDLAYLIYTSGSTGRPKGVMVEHRNVINFIAGMVDRLPISEQESVLCLTTVSFDIFITESILPLLNGLRVVLASEEDQKDTRKLSALIRSGVDVVQITPSHLKGLLADQHRDELFGAIRLLLVGGEAFPQELFHALKKTYQGPLYNMYGPTETTVWSTVQHLTDADTVDIGTPIANTRVRILDEYQKLQPVGVAGELCIGGAGVSRGYFANKELTEARFITDPVSGKGRLYKTGDLAKWLPDGSIAYLGRMDNQVKLRGFRIELGEIEYQLAEMEEVSEVAVAIRENEGEKYLIAYYVADIEVEADRLKEHLSTKVPDYMIPGFFMQLDKMPLTENGKLNRKALPELDMAAAEDFVAPANEVEEKLVKIWEDVLRIPGESISVKSSFFNLGGHSLRSIALVNKIFREFQVEIPIKLTFELKDIQSLGRYIQSAEKSDYLAIEKNREQKDYYALASAQKAIYFFHTFDPGSLAYNMPQVLRVEGRLDREKLEYIFKGLLDRHEILRTSFIMINDEPVQVVAEAVGFEMGFEEIQEENLRSRIGELIRPFNLEEAPLFRVDLLQVDRDVHYLVVDTHHIVMDGTSHGILAGEFVALYNNESLPPLKLQYKDYAEWQQSDARLEKLEKQKEFWTDEFADGITRLQLPTDFNDVAQAHDSGGSTHFKIGAEDTARLKAIIEQEGASMFMFILAIYNILLSKLASQEDIIVGTPVAGREHFDMENMLGMFVAALPLRNRPENQLSFREFLQTLVGKTLAYFENQAYQYEAPVHELNVQRSTSENALYNAFFIFQNFERAAEGVRIPDLHFTAYDTGDGGDTWYDITLIAVELDEQLSLNLGCNKLFKHETRERFVCYFRKIIDLVIHNLDIPLAEIDIITATEKSVILNDFNNTRADLNKEKPFIQYFLDQAASIPDNIAAAHQDTTLSYSQLRERVIALSSCLRAKGVKAGEKVALYMPRGLDMLTSILAVFHAGGAYVPIDVDYPAQRVRNILSDSEAAWLLFNDQSAGDIAAAAEDATAVSTLLNVQQLDKEKFELIETPGEQTTDDLAYIIYTSGTTGKPKGAMIHQLGMINHMGAKINDLELTSADVIAQTASPCFDISVWQFLAALLVGGKTTIVDTATLVNPEKLIHTLTQKQVSIFESVPSLITAFLDGLPSGVELSLPSLRWMIPTGEALTVPLVRKWYKHFPQIKLLNAYGPTEASDDVTHHVVPMPETNQLQIAIGKPVQNTHIYVMDQNLNLCPVGIRGEICVAGPGVGKGYWKNEEKTREAFRDNPLLDEINDPDYARLYKTGDIGYYRNDGSLICLGRVDEQVKIRGFRIELGEIENVLSDNTSVKEAVVVVREKDEDKHLVAYFLADQEVATADLRDYLFERLPDYMVPGYFMQLDEFPLTTNGKLNKAALPEPTFGEGSEYLAPSGKTEEKLLEIWAEVLEMEPDKISAVESFFFIGGHSLNSITLTSKVHKEFNVKIPLKEFFAKPTIRLLASHIDAHQWLNEKPQEQKGKKKEIII